MTSQGVNPASVPAGTADIASTFDTDALDYAWTEIPVSKYESLPKFQIDHFEVVGKLEVFFFRHVQN